MKWVIFFFPYQGGQVEHANAKDRLFYLYMDTNRLSSSLGLKNDWATSLLLVLLLLSSGMSWLTSTIQTSTFLNIFHLLQLLFHGLYCSRLLSFGSRGSEVRVLSPRPFKTMGYGLDRSPFFVWGGDGASI